MFTKSLFFLGAAATIAVAAPSPPGDPDPVGGGVPTIEFVCSDTPELCNNMCWGAYCTDQGDGAIGVTLTYDAPDPKTTDARYKAACQTPKNRCSGNGDYNSCDEYPFKQTSDADLDHAVSRCVTPNAQSIQGGKISALTQKLTAPAQFTVVFGNPGDSKFCSYPPTCDNSDGAEWQNGGPAPSPKNPPSRKRHLYLTARGTEVMSAVPLQVGSNLTSFEIDEGKMAENVRKLGKRDPSNEYRTVDNAIVEHLLSM